MTFSHLLLGAILFNMTLAHYLLWDSLVSCFNWMDLLSVSKPLILKLPRIVIRLHLLLWIPLYFCFIGLSVWWQKEWLPCSVTVFKVGRKSMQSHSNTLMRFTRGTFCNHSSSQHKLKGRRKKENYMHCTWLLYLPSMCKLHS